MHSQVELEPQLLGRSAESSELEVQEMENKSVDVSAWQAKPRYKSAITPEVDYLTQSY